MNIYRFVGSEALIGEIEMNRFGQRFAMDELAAKNAQRGGAAILDEPSFQQIGFTSEDLKVWSDPFMPVHDTPADLRQAAAKAAFLVKKEKAHEAYRAIRLRLIAEHDAEVLGAPAAVVEASEEDVIDMTEGSNA